MTSEMTCSPTSTSSVSYSRHRMAAAARRFHRRVLCNPWIPHRPHPKQGLFLLHDDWFEGLYGGAAGGAKSDALLMAAAEYVDVPGYAALLLRESFPHLNQPDALIPRSKAWWYGKASWNEQAHRWTFPSGATITFGYLENDSSVYQYQGAAYQFVGVDELTQHTESRYTYLASRVRKPSEGPLAEVPLRLRGATNPGGKGHDWVRQRFLTADFLKATPDVQFSKPWYKGDRFFIPARLEDNPALNLTEYERGMAVLDPVTRAQLRRGDWKAHAGGRFKEEWFRRYKDLGDAYLLAPLGELVYYPEVWRFIAVDPAGGVSDFSDYTAIGVWAVTPQKDLLLLEVQRERIPVEGIVPAVAKLCAKWRPNHVVMEEVFLQSALVRQARQHPDVPTVYAIDPGGKSKLVRATPAIIRAEAGQVFLPNDAPWLDDYTAELCQFTGDPEQDGHDDQVDMTAYAVLALDQFGLLHADEPVVTGRKRGER